MRDGITWKSGDWSAAGFVNYIGGSSDPLSSPVIHVSPWTTVDFQISRSFSKGTILAGSRIDLSIQNLFDANPPFVNPVDNELPGLDYDTTNANGIGRFVSLQFVHQW